MYVHIVRYICITIQMVMSVLVEIAKSDAVCFHCRYLHQSGDDVSCVLGAIIIHCLFRCYLVWSL